MASQLMDPLTTRTLFAAALFVVALVHCGCSRMSGTEPPAREPSSFLSPPAAAVTLTYLKQHGRLVIGDNTGIFTVGADGTGKTLLATGPGNEQPSWTPDGKIIFISNRSGSKQIWIMDADGAGSRQIGNLTMASDNPIFRPQIAKNGLIVFANLQSSPTQTKDNPGPQNGTWIMNEDGSGIRHLVPYCGAPSLAISGKWLTCTKQTEDPYHREIWRINTDGSGEQQLTFTGDPDYPDANASAISPDESMVAFFSGKESDQGYGGLTQDPATWGHRNVAIIPATGGVRKTLTSCVPITQGPGSTDCVAADNPTWSPDGNWIMYDTDRGGTWIIDVKGQSSQQLSATAKGVVIWPLKYFN